TGTWELNFNATHSTTGNLEGPLDKQFILNFAPDGVQPPPDPPKGFRARFIARFPTPQGEAGRHAEGFTGARNPTTAPAGITIPRTVVHLDEADGGIRAGIPYYSTWSGALTWDWTDPAHPKDTKLFVGYYADLMKDWGRFEMKKRG